MKELSFLALPIVGGYAFATIWIGSLIFASRESGDRLYFRAVFYGCWLYVCALALHIILFSRLDSYPSFVAAVGMLNGGAGREADIFDGSSTLVIAFLAYILGPLFGWMLNLHKYSFITRARIPFTSIRPFKRLEGFNKWLLFQAIKNNDQERLVARSFYEKKPILWTLASGKFYIGFVVDAPNPVHERRYVRILPLLSGYRDQITQKLKFTTDYQFLFDDNRDDGVNLEDFEIVLPLDHVSATHQFDLVMHDRYFEPGFRVS